MTTSLALELGATVRTSDGPVGELVRVVLEPHNHRVTHVVVRPKHRHEPERLVPIARCAASDGTLELACTSAQFERFESAAESEVQHLPELYRDTSTSSSSIFSYPFLTYEGSVGQIESTGILTVDHVPFGEVEVRGGTHVHAADGKVGKLRGVLVDPETSRMTHLLVEQGRLWSQRQVAIPDDAVAAVGDGVTDVSWPKAQIKRLAAIGADDTEATTT